MPSRKTAIDDLERIHPRTRAAWRSWLEANHRTSPGCWLVSYRTRTGKPRVEYAEAVEEMLCFGWIDSKAVTLDEERTMQLCVPRRPTSAWARSNKERVERLTAAGLMAPRGLEVVEAAKRSGSWSALDDVDALITPRDLAAAFRARKGSRANFDAFPPSVKREILAWISQAKRPETRARRVQETARLAAKNVRANQRR